MENISDGEAFQAMTALAKNEGTAAEPVAAVAFAGVLEVIEQKSKSEEKDR